MPADLSTQVLCREFVLGGLNIRACVSRKRHARTVEIYLNALPKLIHHGVSLALHVNSLLRVDRESRMLSENGTLNFINKFYITYVMAIMKSVIKLRCYRKNYIF